MKEHAQRLVGRDEELKTLERLLTEAKQGTPRFAQITGEPGIGKTYLLDEVGRRADADGWLVLNGRSAELERELPFGLVVDAFDAYLASLDPHDWQRIAPEELSELAGIFPSLRSMVPEPENPRTAEERFRAHRAVVEMIERLAARQPVLLLLDDIHWSDGASIEQAGYVLRRPPQAPVMVVGSFRTGQADPALVVAVETAMRGGTQIELIELGPLAPKDAAQLVADAPGRERALTQSGGNPFYLLQLARTGNGGAAADGAVPTTVAAALAGELDHLAAPARTLAEAAAVVGDPFELDLAAETGELSQADALDGIDDLMRADLIRTTEVPRQFQFRHPLVRSAIYEASPPGRRLAGHQRASQVLAVRGAPATDRAHHVEHAATYGDADAAEVLTEAASEAAGRAPRTAIRWYEAALRLLGETASAEQRLQILVPLSSALAAVGRLEDCHAALVEAIALTTPEGPVPAVRLISGCAAVEQLIGRQREARVRLETALEELAADDTEGRASLMIDLAVDAFYRADYENMREWGDRSIEAAGPDGPPALRAAGLAVTAFGRSCAGPIDECKQQTDAAAEIIDGLTDEELAARLDAITWISAAELYLDRCAQAERHARRGLEISRRVGQGQLLPALTQALANSLYFTDRPLEAAGLMEESIEAARLADSPIGLAWSLLNHAFALLIAGDPEAAVQSSTEAYELTREAPESPVRAWAAANLGRSLFEAGEYARAAEIMIDGAGGPDGPRVAGVFRAVWLLYLTRIMLALDRTAEAQEAADLSVARAEAFGLEQGFFASKRALAEIAFYEGDNERAAELALASAEHSAAIGNRTETGHALTLAGRALARAGDTDRAVAELERAVAEFEVTGGQRWRQQAEAELRKLGRSTHRRSHPGSGEGVASLTGREREVADLVVDRRTNAEIAAELFLSVKTVETHMRNIFRKLDVSSRVEVARAVEAESAGART